jgi:hypothetical protein
LYKAIQTTSNSFNVGGVTDKGLAPSMPRCAYCLEKANTASRKLTSVIIPTQRDPTILYRNFEHCASLCMVHKPGLKAQVVKVAAAIASIHWTLTE